MAKTERNRKLFLNFIILGLVCLFIFSCSIKSDKQGKINQEYFYLINNPIFDSLPEENKIYYGNNNFILDSNNKVFYNNKYVEDWCGMGVDYSKDLLAEEIEEIKIDSLNKFLDRKIKENRYTSQPYITISSPTDTIKNLAFPVIFDFIKSNKIKMYLIRKWTKEEKNAMMVKLKDTIK